MIENEQYDAAKTVKNMRIKSELRDFHIGDKLVCGRYEIKKILGQGGMGIVYQCTDLIAKVDVALKTIPPELHNSQNEMEELKNNFRTVSKLSHPNIAAVRTIEEDLNCTFLVMDFVDGVNLKKWARTRREEHGPSLEEVIFCAGQLASALDYAHSEGVVHRDVKPQNIMITPDNKVKLLDFGLAAQVQTGMSHISMIHLGISGTAPYMAPEQWCGDEQKAASDQYAMAVTVYELLAGHPPFDNTDKEILRACVLTDAPEKIADVPDCVNSALQKALSKKPDDRFTDCLSFINALQGNTNVRKSFSSFHLPKIKWK